MMIVTGQVAHRYGAYIYMYKSEELHNLWFSEHIYMYKSEELYIIYGLVSVV